MSERTRGRPSVVGPVDVIEVFLERDDPFEPLTASEVAEELGVTRKTASNKLRDLPDGVVNTKKPGAKSRVWWPERAVWYPHLSTMLFEADAADILDRSAGEPITIDGESEIPEIGEVVIEALELPGDGDVLASRRAAIRSIYAELIEQEQATKQDLLQPVSGYAHGYESEESFWSNLILQHEVMHQLPGVLTPGEAGRYYQWVGVGGAVGLTPNS